MAAIVLGSLAGATITYNTVQFGGSEATQTSVPPTYRFRGEFVTDDSGRTIIKTRYTLTVNTIFHEADEAAMAASMTELRELLKQPRGVLKIEGLGTGFETVETDMDWGPLPLFIDCMPLGPASWQLTWIVQFHIAECPSGGRDPLAFAAFNFDTTWQNDFEGVCERTISGYAEIAMRIVSRTPLHVADEVRDRIQIVCPVGFERVSNVWRENTRKNRLDFVVTDRWMSGDYLPTGCTDADGEVTFQSAGPGFAEAVTTLAMSLTTAPTAPRGLAGAIFLTAAISKMNRMIAGNSEGTVIPMSLQISAGKFRRARNTTASMTWAMTKCINAMMNAAHIWEPVVVGDYSQWRTSVEHLWNNRGVSTPGFGIGSLASEAVVIDLCANATNAVIGNTTSTVLYTIEEGKAAFTCPDIPEDGGWLGHDLQVRILRKDEQSWHRKAVPYSPSPGDAGNTPPNGGVPSNTDRVPLGGPSYSQGSQGGSNTEHGVEHHGLPVVYVLLSFRGLRVKHKPAMPYIKTIAGLPTTLVEEEIDGPKWAFDMLTCPAWYIRGYRVYRVNGYVPDLAATNSKTSCAAPFDDSQGQNV